MSTFTTKQILLPLITLAFILFMYFGPLPRTPFEHVIIILVILLTSFIEHKKKTFEALGLSRKKFDSKNLLVFAPLVAFGLFLLYVIVLVPGIELITGVPIDYSSMQHLEGDLSTTLLWLALVWIVAGFGEEIIFRGYLMRQFIKLFGDSWISLIINILLFSVLFGFMHMQQGITGQLVAGITGALFSILFYKRNYDLWFMIMIHGTFDTIGLLCFYFGLA